ncbi:TRAP transporter substrate-binding protein DctP [Zobellella aerophila]|uniref:TRAP transporter substrate-binding protein DctP n=1 Tax=Zobellella aerophila TaxID=870480 RepID=A0ABP6W2N1_9GAMM
MKTRTQYTTLAKSLLLSLTLAGTAAAADTLKISHVRPQGTAIDLDVQRLSDALKAATDGELKLKIYPANALGDYTVVQERVGLGAIDMAVQPPSSTADKRFQVIYMPYMVKNWDDARTAYAPGSTLRNTIDELYREQDIKVLAAWPVYFGGIALNKEVANVTDPSDGKGAKLRVPPMKSFQMLADNTGFIGAPLPFSEAFTAVQTGVVDGVMGSGAEGYYASFRDVTKSYVPLNTHFEVWFLQINAERYASLDEDERSALDQAAQDFERRRWESARADQAAYEQRLADAGATIVEVTDADIQAYADVAREQIWPEIMKDIGQDWAEQVLAQFK